MQGRVKTEGRHHGGTGDGTWTAAEAVGAVVIDASDDESTDMDESEALTVE